jgi:diaminopimelate epimerase
MKKINFVKFQASGNDFILIDQRREKVFNYRQFAKKICHRKFGIGADGLLVIEKSRSTDFKMRIFNSDGSEAAMCGNGARCAAKWFGKKHINFETKAGIIEGSLVGKDSLKIKMTKPFGLKLDINVNVFGRGIKVSIIDTGVPHAVIFVDSLDDMNIDEIGREVRFHEQFAPMGVNVNFAQVVDKGLISIRTYERGVEGETLACGTGTVASAIIFAVKSDLSVPVKVRTKSNELTRVYLERDGEVINNAWLEGRAYRVFEGKL